jgi:hypothetical protein
MAKNQYSQAAKMLRVRTILDNIRKPDMLDPLLPHGYDSTTIDEGDGLYTTADTKIKEQRQAISDKVKATRALNILEKAVKGTFTQHVTMARRALSSQEDHIKDLGIYGSLERSMAKWTDEAITFYSTAMANPDILLRLARFNIIETVLQQGLDDINGLITLNSEQEEKKGKAQSATEDKKKAIAALEKWIGDLLMVCRIAYIDDPQKLERLTIIVYSDGYKKKSSGTDPGTDPGTNPTDPTDLGGTDPGTGTDPAGEGGGTPGT